MLRLDLEGGKMSMLELLYRNKDLKGDQKMELISAKIQGFRNIEEDFLEFGKITSLVSINSYGKSNLMKAMEFAIDFIKNEKDLKSSMMAWSFGVPLNKHIEAKNFLADFTFKTTMNQKSYYVNYGFEFMWIKNENEGAQIIDEWLNLKLEEKKQRFNTFIDRKNNKGFYKSSPTGRCTSAMKISNNELMINKLLLNENLFYFDIIEKINALSVYIERHLDTTSSYQPNPLVKRDLNESDLNDIDNIPRAIFRLKKNYPDKYLILKDAYKQLFPNIENIEVEEFNITSRSKMKMEKDVPYLLEDKVYMMHVKDSNLNQPISFERLSDGARRVFLMLTYAVLADITGLSLIAFEEPENSVHPSLLQAYLNVLMQLANKCKIIIASHSPYILQYVNTEDIYIGLPNNKGLASFKRIDSKRVGTLLNDSSDADESIGNYIFDLLSGSEDEIEILEGYLER